MDDKSQELDNWDLALEEQLKIIKQCQQNLNIDSCTKCEKLLECIIRKQYVKSVYESMSKGSGGGFEF